MKPKPEIRELNEAIEEFDRLTAGEFDRETCPKTLVLFAGAFSPRGSDLPSRMAKAFRAVDKAPCNHNKMIETGDRIRVWKCSDCGYVYEMNE